MSWLCTNGGRSFWPYLLAASSLHHTAPHFSLLPQISFLCLPTAAHAPCLTLSITSPLTSPQLILSSNASSTRPTAATLSPRTMYKPCETSELGSSSSAGRMIRSRVFCSTYFVLARVLRASLHPISPEWRNHKQMMKVWGGLNIRGSSFGHNLVVCRLMCARLPSGPTPSLPSC